MIKYLGLAFFMLLGSIYSYCQEQKTIYEVGKPLTSCECNFENLFANWGPRFVTNHDSTKLVSWTFVETLKDTTHIDFYAKKFTDPKGLFSQRDNEWEVKYRDDGSRYVVKTFAIRPHFLKPDTIFTENTVRAEVKYFSEIIKQQLSIGDKVFRIQFIFDNKEYDFEVICRPGENKVVLDKLYFNDIVELYPEE